MLNTKTTKGTKAEETASAVVDSALEVHREFGPGLLESLYEKCLAHELTARGLRVECQRAIPALFKGQHIDVGFRADLIVEELVLVEVKAIEALQSVHTAQTLTYLRLARLPIGFLINFNVPLLKQGMKRLVL